MFEIKRCSRKIDGKTITTFTREVCSANILEVEAGTNGFRGGDSSSGSRTYIRIQDQASTDIRVKALGVDGSEGVEIIVGGDCELETMIKALKFITQVLEEGINDPSGIG